jgi:hypothetical protein
MERAQDATSQRTRPAEPSGSRIRSAATSSQRRSIFNAGLLMRRLITSSSRSPERFKYSRPSRGRPAIAFKPLAVNGTPLSERFWRLGAPASKLSPWSSISLSSRMRLASLGNEVNRASPSPLILVRLSERSWRLDAPVRKSNPSSSIDGEQHSQSPAISPCRFGCRDERFGRHSRDSVWGFAVWHIRVLKKNPHDLRF